MSRRTTSQKMQRNRAVVTGTKKYFRSTPLVLDQKAFTVDEFTAEIEAHTDAMSTVAEARVALKTAIAKERHLDKKVAFLVDCMRGFVMSHFSSRESRCEEFGFKAPRKRGPKTAESKALAVVKRRETRKLRHTMGKRQKAKIKGTVP